MAAFAAVAAVLSACSGDPGGTGDSGAASESAASAVPAGPPPEAVTLAQMDASKIPVSGAPDWIADDGTSVFVKTDSGTVAVIGSIWLSDNVGDVVHRVPL